MMYFEEIINEAHRCSNIVIERITNELQECIRDNTTRVTKYVTREELETLLESKKEWVNNRLFFHVLQTDIDTHFKQQSMVCHAFQSSYFVFGQNKLVIVLDWSECCIPQWLGSFGFYLGVGIFGTMMYE